MPLAGRQRRKWRAELAKCQGASGSTGFCSPMEVWRPFILVRDDSKAAILEAVRARRSVFYDRAGRRVGDLELTRLTVLHSRFGELRPPLSDEGFLSKTSPIAGHSRALLPISVRPSQTGTNEFRIGVTASRSERSVALASRVCVGQH